MSVTARRQLVRFLLTGGAASLVYSVVSAALVSVASAPAFLSGLVLFCVMIPIVFSVQKRYTFRSPDAALREFVLYAAVQICTFAAVSFFGTAFLTGTYLLDVGVFLVMVGASAMISFALCRHLIFKPQGSTAR
jgi:putative flippase GtrA